MSNKRSNTPMGKNGIPVVTGGDLLQAFLTPEERIVTNTRQGVPNLRDPSVRQSLLETEGDNRVDEDFEALLEEFLPPKIEPKDEDIEDDIESDSNRIQAKIDLHGMRKNEAIRALMRFIRRCTKDKLSKVEIITGRGLHSENGVPVIKTAAKANLENLKKVGSIKKIEWKNKGGTAIVYL